MPLVQLGIGGSKARSGGGRWPDPLEPRDGAIESRQCGVEGSFAHKQQR